MGKYESGITEYLLNKFGYLCPVAMEKGWNFEVTDHHHARVHNTLWARKKYPIFINSVFNIRLLSNWANTHFTSWGKWPEIKVQRYEEFLNKPHHWKFKHFALKGEWPKSN